MPLNAYATIRIDGDELEGEHATGSMGGVDVSGMVECHEVRWGATVAESTSMPVRRSSPVSLLRVALTKPVDRTTPRLYRALGEHRHVEVTIRLFDRHPDTGETRHHVTVDVLQGRIVAIRSTSPDVLDPAAASLPAREVVEIQPLRMRYVDEEHGTEYEMT